jgi:hypothetical protein
MQARSTEDQHHDEHTDHRADSGNGSVHGFGNTQVNQVTEVLPRKQFHIFAHTVQNDDGIMDGEA